MVIIIIGQWTDAIDQSIEHRRHHQLGGRGGGAGGRRRRAGTSPLYYIIILGAPQGTDALDRSMDDCSIIINQVRPLYYIIILGLPNGLTHALDRSMDG